MTQTPLKVFISYSHKDETYKDSLVEHLTMLRRDDLISEWNDRKIIPGQQWEEEISRNLNEADIIIFLISTSFLSSEYCYNKEGKRALERHREGTAELIPIVVRPCDWHSSPLAKFQGLPKDAEPISKWADEDEAWLNVVRGIRTHIAHFSKQVGAPQPVTVTSTIPTVTPTTLEWLEDTEVVLSHRHVNRIKLSDVYVALDMEQERVSKMDELVIKSSEKTFEKVARYLVTGEEQQGKTTFLKAGFKHFANKGTPIVYVDAKEINSADMSKFLSKALTQQFTGMTLEQYLASETKVLLLDNLHEMSLNERFRSTLLSRINSEFDHVIVTANSSFNYVASEIDELDDYQKYELLSLGNLKREEITEKWVSLGVEESIPEQDLFNQVDDIKGKLDAVIRKNIVPAKPIYVLMLLQMLEVGSQQNLDLSSYGHCYQQLIYKSFDNAKIHKKEFDTYLNVLTELSWMLYKHDGSINSAQLDTFFSNYKNIYLAVDGALIIEKLKSCSVLQEKDFKIGFKYPYLYYFFVAKKIAESYSTEDDTKAVVKNLIENLHREDYANVLVFVTHHTKERWVLTEIKEALDSLFVEQQPAMLAKEQLVFMQEFIAKIPELVIEQREIRSERSKYNAELDLQERNDERALAISEESERLLAKDIPAVINKTFKGMELSGQIIRNRHATLPRAELLALAGQGANCGLRFLTFFIDISDAAKSEVIKYVANSLRDHPNLTNQEIQEQATTHFLSMTYGVINGVIRKIASSIGSKEAAEIYAQLQGSEPKPSITLLNQAIELQFTRKLNIATLTTTYESLKNNPVCLRILKDMAVQHSYMFPVNYKEKQQLSELLNISVDAQRKMDRRMIGKA